MMIKPCPFCGKQPETGPTNPEREGNAWGYVACVNEKCQAQPRVKDGALSCDERGTKAYIAAAVRRWNRRAKPQPYQHNESE